MLESEREKDKRGRERQLGAHNGEGDAMSRLNRAGRFGFCFGVGFMLLSLNRRTGVGDTPAHRAATITDTGVRAHTYTQTKHGQASSNQS